MRPCMRPTARVLVRPPTRTVLPPFVRPQIRPFSLTPIRRSATQAPDLTDLDFSPVTAVHGLADTLQPPGTEAEDKKAAAGSGLLGAIRTHQGPKQYLAFVTKRAQLLLAQGKVDEVLGLWTTTLERRVAPDSMFAVLLLNGFGQAQFREGVRTVIADWLKLGLRNGSVMFSALYNLERLGEYEAALQLYEQNKHHVEDHDGTLTTVVLIYIRLGRIEKAREVQQQMHARGHQLPAALWTTLFNALGVQRRYDEMIALLKQLRTEGVKVSDITYSCVVNHVMTEPRHFDFARGLLREMEQQGMPLSAEVAHTVIRRLAETAQRQRSYPLLEQAMRRWKGRAKIELAEAGLHSRLAQSLGDLAHMILEIALSLSKPRIAEELLRHPAVLRSRSSQQIAVMHRKLALSYSRQYNLGKMMEHYELAAEVMVCDARAYNYLLAACIHAQAWSIAERLLADIESYKVPVPGYLAATVVNLAAKANLPATAQRFWQRWLELPRADTERFTEIYTAVARFTAATGSLQMAKEAVQAMQVRNMVPSGFFYASYVEGALKQSDLKVLEEVVQRMATLGVQPSVRVHDSVTAAFKKQGSELPAPLLEHLRKALTTAHSSSYSEFGVATKARE